MRTLGRFLVGLMICGFATLTFAEDQKPAAAPEILKASKVIGTKVLDKSGAEIGKIEELLFASTEGKTLMAVLSGNDTVGKDRFFAIPFEGLKASKDKSLPTGDLKGFELVLDPKLLSGAPSFAKDQWPAALDKPWQVSVYEFYHMKPSPNVDVSVKKEAVAEMNLYRVSQLMGREVRNAQDEKLGKIEDFAVDAEAARLPYSVLSFGGVLGVGDKFFAVPWHSLMLGPPTANPSDQKIVVAVEKNRLKEAPGIDKDHWPATPQTTLFGAPSGTARTSSR